MKARQYMRDTRNLEKGRSYNAIVNSMSPSIRLDVILQMSVKTLDRVWYLRLLGEAATQVAKGVPKEAARGLLAELAVAMHRDGFAPRERVSAVSLSILMRGVAAKGGNILTEGAVWGEDIIVTSMALRDLRTASALTYVEVSTLTREDLDAAIALFPEVGAYIRAAAMKIAMQRSVVIISEFVRMAKRNQDKAVQLASAFGGGASVIESGDPAAILRVVTGCKARDIDADGHLIEEVEEGPDVEELDPSKMSASELQRKTLDVLKGQHQKVEDLGEKVSRILDLLEAKAKKAGGEGGL